MSSVFDPAKFYKSYPSKIILRPGYPARAQYKSTLLWDLYGHQIRYLLGKIRTYADIGGTFGFGANAMAFHISKYQEEYPRTMVFEISPDFITTGKQLFPYINFIQGDFRNWDRTPRVFDLTTMFDLIEHIPDPISFLSEVAKRSRYILLNTPIETSGDWFGAKPPINQGANHSDGHVNFFTPKTYLRLLEESGLEILDGKFILSFVPPGAERILSPEYQPSKPSLKRLGLALINHRIIPYYFVRKVIGGGYHICLARSIENYTIK